MTPLKKVFSSVTVFLAFTALNVIYTTASHAQSTLLHYWSFNKITARVNIPAAAIKADYSFLDTNKAVVQYDTLPGTPQHFVDSINTNSKSNGAFDNVAGDTTNARLGYAAGNGLRVRNPSWSSQLRIYLPTTLYNNPIVKYALQSSSTNSGQHWEVFAYSIDSGATWKTTGMTVNGAVTDTLDCTQSKYQSATSYGLVTVAFFGDSSVNNNPKFVFRMTFSGQASTFSGNNRIDNLSVEAGPVPRTITVTNPVFGDTLITGQRDTIAFTTTGKISKMKWEFYSLDSGRSWTSFGTDTAFSFVWTAPPVVNPVRYAMLAVEDSAGVTGHSSPFVILPVRYYPPDSNLIYYWHFNGFSGAYSYPNVPNIPADYSVEAGSNAEMTYLISGNATGGLVQDATGTTVNRQMLYPAGRAVEFDNPTNNSELRFYIPTPNRKNIKVNFALQTTDGTTGPLVASYDFSLDSGLTWQTTGLKHLSDSINGTGYTNGNWGLISVPLLDSLTSDNPNLVFRIRFSGNNSRGLVRIDNLTVTGPVGHITIVGSPVLVHYWNFNNLAGPYSRPVPKIDADYSLLDTSKAYLEYYVLPGTSSTWAAGNN
ncbi:MAG: hypothetical protein ACHQNE_05935, partial [Candidatus Kapaibacterium sp.]